MVLAGCSAKLNGCAVDSGVRVDLDDLAGEPRVEDAQEDPQPGPTPCRVNRPSAPVIAGLGQPGRSSG